MKAREIPVEQPGIAFEKVVAAIQAKIDPAAAVSHNEVLTDRLGQKRQFDVVLLAPVAVQPIGFFRRLSELLTRLSTGPRLAAYGIEV